MSANLPDTGQLEERIGYRFRDKDLLVEAMTHKSYYYENRQRCPGHNERLEFLGDAVIAFSVSSFLFDHDRVFSESEMSKIKSYIVKGSVLCTVAERLNLGGYLRLGKGEGDSGGREKVSLLANAFEALVGALYRDGGFETARSLVLQCLGDEMAAVIKTGDYHDYKTELQERSQPMFDELPEYRLLAQDGLDHAKTFTVEVYIRGKLYGTGVGKSKKEAEKRAAREAVERLAG